MDCALLAKSAAVLPDHAHFLATETYIFDRHAEEHVFVLLVIGSKGVLVGNTSSASSAHAFAKSGSSLLMVAIRLDSRCMRSSLVIVL